MYIYVYNLNIINPHASFVFTKNKINKVIITNKNSMSVRVDR